MPIGFKIKSDVSAVNTYLTRLRYGLDNNIQPALQNAAEELTKRAQDRFKTKTDPDGKRWQPWAPSTRLARRHDMANGKRVSLMVYDGKLRDSVRFIAGKKDLRAYYGQHYGVFHEQPNGPGLGKVPRRAFLLSSRGNGRSLSADDEKYVLNALRYQVRKLGL